MGLHPIKKYLVINVLYITLLYTTSARKFNPVCLSKKDCSDSYESVVLSRGQPHHRRTARLSIWPPIRLKGLKAATMVAIQGCDHTGRGEEIALKSFLVM